ncbi:LuxR C-terminal-related transcriptional regulator [Microbacterium sp. YY-01]|uniref:helix-turn-helix transcriptional regulator n=1 Tax=Microbacterium sp. YY-01 TaxID=3421634 RepID=UPI003D17C29B
MGNARLGTGALAVRIITSHRLAGSALSVFLGRALARNVAWSHPADDALDATVSVVLAVHESAEIIPRLIRASVARGSRTVVVYDGARPQRELLDAAMHLGAWNACDVRQDQRMLVGQIRSAISGDRWERDRFAEHWSRALEHPVEHLSHREREVIDAYFAADTVTPDHVAAQLGISVNTVRVHLANVRRKLSGRHTSNREALRAALIDQGWLDAV